MIEKKLIELIPSINKKQLTVKALTNMEQKSFNFQKMFCAQQPKFNPEI
jgi:hypothetical protein